MGNLGDIDYPLAEKGHQVRIVLVAHDASCVPGVDTLDNAGDPPVGKSDVEVQMAQIATGVPGVGLPNSVRGWEAFDRRGRWVATGGAVVVVGHHPGHVR